jgi:hypothetical protein
MEDRKGFLTPEQVKIAIKLSGLKGVYAVAAALVLRLLDDLLLERVKVKIPNAEETLPTVYLIIDEIFGAFGMDEFYALLKEFTEEKELPDNVSIS